ncbi:MAG: SpoIIE family protein phosphatase [Crocinitomix sp.]|nr:SpoIIE family protein phosphatase [Crocinitomix sp.]
MKKIEEELSFNRLSLTFRDKTVEKEYRQEIVNKLFTYFKIGAAFGLIVYSMFIIFDFLENKEVFRLLLINRIIVISIVFVFFILLFTPFTKKYYFFTAIFLFLTLGLGVIQATFATSTYISGIYSVIVFFNLIPFLTIPIAIVCNLFLAVMFFIALQYSPGFDPVYVMKEVTLLATAMFFTLLAAYIKQRVERSNYIKTKKNEKAKALIDLQFDELELTHKSITDSINYAERIQKALLPSKEKISNLAIDVELFYQPKDTIGGDFYWVDEVGDTIVIAVGDCTGHGVPGAIMTSLGINGLINSVTEQGMTDPSDILSYLDNYIYELLNYSDKAYRVKDGMDIGIVCINKKLNTLSFSNACRPLFYIDNGRFATIKSSRRSIGSKHITTPFKTETLTISNTATYYLFSDGMTDQFGGEKNKRLTTKTFKQLLIDWSGLSLSDQKIKLEEFYTHFTKNTKQTDDMIWGAIQIN